MQALYELSVKDLSAMPLLQLLGTVLQLQSNTGGWNAGACRLAGQSAWCLVECWNHVRMFGHRPRGFACPLELVSVILTKPVRDEVEYVMPRLGCCFSLGLGRMNGKVQQPADQGPVRKFQSVNSV